MKIQVKTLKGDLFDVELGADDTVDVLKSKIEQRLNLPKAHQKLIYAGKILTDAQPVVSYGIKENDFLVLFTKPTKAEKDEAKPPEKRPEEVRPAAPAAAAQTPASPAPVVSQPAATPSPAQPAASPAAQPQAAAPAPAGSSFVVGDEYETMVKSICDMGFPREQVIRALNASFRNPDRAVQYLIQGDIPEVEEPRSPAQVPVAPAGSPGGGLPSGGLPAAAVPAGGLGSGGGQPIIPPNVNILPTVGGGTPANFAAGPFESLRQHPQFNALRALVQQNPQLLQPVLQQLAQANPQILQLIQQHQDEFIRLLQEPVEGDPLAGLNPNVGGLGAGGLGAGVPGGAGGGAPPGSHMIQVTQAEKEAIDRLVGMGFERNRVIEAFFACDKDEQMAANYLLEHMGDEMQADFGDDDQ